MSKRNELTSNELRRKTRQARKLKRSNRRTCAGKVQYMNKEDALRVVKRPADWIVKAYKCLHCKKWHVGSRQGERVSALLNRINIDEK